MVQFNEEEQNAKLAQLRAQEEEALAQVLSDKYGVGYTDLSLVPINGDALRLIPEEQARAAEVVAFKLLNKKLDIAVKSPNNEAAQRIIKSLEEQGYITNIFMVSSESLRIGWDHYKDLSLAAKSAEGSMSISDEDVTELIKNVHNIDDVRAFIEDVVGNKKSTQISRIVEIFIAGALATDASDIHIEPEENKVRLRFRLDGVLTDISMITERVNKLMVSRIKLMSGLKLNVHSEAQDGRFSIKIGDSSIEIRTSIIPSEYGESIVMRILNPENILVPIEELGIDNKLFSIVERELRKPNGMILTTGPTGSGKTTMLYASLRKIHTPDVKIITVEDPIEYHLEGIVQTQSDEDGGYTFATGLRAILRQDPDVVMIGEIRDMETAGTAINAALTGHLVFSTLHTNNAAGSFPRLFDLGVSPKIAASAIRLALAQRLVRTLCNECKEKVPIDAGLKFLIDEIVAGIVDTDHAQERTTNRTHMYQAVGCDACGGSGYKGRIGIFEAVVMDEAVAEALEINPSERGIHDAARTQGLLSMREDGVLKVLEGVTTLEELTRVIELSAD